VRPQLTPWSLSCPIKVLLILALHYAASTNCTERCEIQTFSLEGPTALGYTARPLVFARADLKEVQASEFHNLSEGVELPKVTHFTNKAGSSDLTDPFERKKRCAVGNLLQMMTHLLFQFFKKPVT
jgi:hypothetical protein